MLLKRKLVSAQEIQTRYLQACQDITAFWVGIGKLYGQQLMEDLRPSVNSPIEILRAIDTVLSIVYADSPRALENNRRISAQTTKAFRDLFSDDSHAARLRNDSYAIICKAMDFYKCKRGEVLYLDRQVSAMQKRYWAKREEVDRLFDLVD